MHIMEKPNVTPKNLLAVAREAKALVALAFRNGPIEDVHAGKACPMCFGKPEYSHITQEEMLSIMKTAVDRIYTLSSPEGERQSRVRCAFVLWRKIHNGVG